MSNVNLFQEEVNWGLGLTMLTPILLSSQSPKLKPNPIFQIHNMNSCQVKAKSKSKALEVSFFQGEVNFFKGEVNFLQVEFY